MTPETILVLGRADSPYLRPLERLPGDLTVHITADEPLVRQLAPRTDVVLCDFAYAQTLARHFAEMRALRWVHSLAAGVDYLLFPALVESEVVLTNGRGAFKRALAEFVIAAALHFAKDVPRLQRQQRAALWEPYDMEELAGKTLGIVGYGEIGQATAALAKAFGMRILALRRRPEFSRGDTNVDEILPGDRLLDLLVRSDYVVVAAPLTAQTRGLIGRAELAALKPTAVLINVGRGPIIDEAALVETLQTGGIRGAALDVFEVEPLPAASPLYRLENVLVSPHTADHVPGWIEAAVTVFVENVERVRSGQPLLNIVDKRAGY